MMSSVGSHLRYDAFVSYADEDREWVEGYLLNALEVAGLTCHHESAFTLGVPRLLEFELAIRESRATILVVSQAYFASSVNALVDVLAMTFGAESGAWPVVPVRLHDCELPPHLRMLEGLDATDEHSWPGVVERLCRHLRAPPPPPSPRPPCPYPGMRPFSPDEADRFFGRDTETRDVVDRLRLYPFLAVIGPSGSGKSSLVNAAVLPMLAQSGLFGPGQWVTRRLRPGSSPMSSLVAAMGGGIEDARAAVDRVLGDSPNANKLLLFVDQLEELFTAALTEAPTFEDAMLQLGQAPRCYVLTTMRADFYPQLMTSRLWELACDHRVEVLPLRGQALNQAITRPAERVGVFIEAALSERLVADAAGEPGLLPLIQETLVCLWERVDRRFLPLSAYEALVLPRSAYGEPERTGLQIAMARRADQTMAELTPQAQVIARRTFLRLVQFGVGRNDVRRQQPVSALRSASDDLGLFEEVLEHLANHRLITVSAQSALADERRVDLAHEALIRGWPTFQTWLQDRRAGEQTRRRLLEKAEEWSLLGRQTGGLLDPAELLEADRWLGSPDAPELGIDESIVELVASSRTAIERSIQEREAAQQRELAQARALAEEQGQRATEQALAARTARRLVAVMSMVVALMVVASGFAVNQRNRANRQAMVAGSRELAGHARSLVDRRLDLALLLSVEAYRRSPTAESKASLREAVERDQHVSRFFVGPVSNGQFPSLTNDIAFSPDGRLLAAGGDDDMVVVWDVAGGRVKGQPLIAHPGYEHRDDSANDVRSIGFSPDGRSLAAASNDGRVWLWNLETGELAGDPLGDGSDPTRHEMRAVAFHPTNGSLLASGNLDGNVVLWDLQSRRARLTVAAPAGVNGVAFSPDGGLLSSANDDGSITVWKMDSGELLHPPLPAHLTRARSVAFSPDGSLLASSGNDSKIVLSDPRTGQVSGEPLTGHTDSAYDVAFSPDGTKLATASADLTARIWDVKTRRSEAAPLAHAASVNVLAFAPDGHTVVTASRDRTSILWRLDGQGRLATVAHHAGSANAVTVSPNGRLVASGGDDDGVILVDTSGEVRLEQFGEAVTSVAFSPDDRYLAAGSWDSQIFVWEVASRRLVMRLQDDPTDGVLTIAFAPDGRTLASGGVKGLVRLWDLETAALRTVLHGPDRPGPDGRGSMASIDVDPAVHSVAFTPNGETLLAGAVFGGIWRWPADGARIEGARLTPWGQFVYTIAITPDGRHVIPAGSTAPSPHGISPGRLPNLAPSTSSRASTAGSPRCRSRQTGGSWRPPVRTGRSPSGRWSLASSGMPRSTQERTRSTASLSTRTLGCWRRQEPMVRSCCGTSTPTSWSCRRAR